MQDEFAETYAELDSWHWWFVARRQIFGRLLREQLDASASRGTLTIASMGSGPPQGLRWLRAFAGANGCIIGLDADPTGVIRKQASVTDAGIHPVIGTMEMPPIRDGSCDAVLALDVLEHLENDVAGLRSAFSLLMPRGLLLVAVPACPSLWGSQDVVSQHYRRYTRQSLVALFRSAGVPMPKVMYYNSLLFPLIASVRLMRRAVGRHLAPRSDFHGSRPGIGNDMLRRIFASERHLIGRVPLPIGVSLIALARS